jgi:myo-inositol-1(or 4)-monophosphatase
MHASDSRPPYHDERHAAIEAAHRAGRIIRERMGAIDPDAAHEKGRNDLVTEVDEAAQQTITELIGSAFPEHTILAEEGADLDAHAATADGFRWIIDPLDGTTNFTYQIPPVAVSIALQRGDTIVVGVVLDVTHRELFIAVRGQGLEVNGRPARVSATDDFARALIATGFPYRRFEHTEQYLDVLGRFLRQTRGVRRHGAASVDLARVAAGRFTGFYETGLKPWDVAAGTLLVEEGGGRVTDYRDQSPPHPIFERQIVASNGAIHGAMLDLLAPMRDVRL